MPTGLAVAGIGAGVGTALIGSEQAQKQAAAAQAARDAAVKQWLNVNIPDPQQQALEFQRYQSTGQLSPQLEKTFQQSQTELNNLKIDPTSRAAEVKALTQMQDLAANGGMDAQSKQKEAEAINTANANEQGQRGAIVQSFAARGQGGSGAQLAAELLASQGDSNRAAATGQSAAADAEQRALAALSSSSGMASNLNSQDYAQAAAKAKAQDEINRFNTQNSQSVDNSNVGITNKAEENNLNTRQRLADQNVGLTNQQEQFNKGLLQQQFQNEVTKSGGTANSEMGQATGLDTGATRTANQWSKIGQAISQGTGAISQGMSDKKKTGTPGTDAGTDEDPSDDTGGN